MQTQRESKVVDYPTSDGRPMSETEFHRDLMFALIESLKAWYHDDPMTYVSGNILLFYEEGNRRRHIAPDVLVTHGIPMRKRDYYLLWEEGKGPDLVIEVTSKTAAKEDLYQKFTLYQDILKVKELFLFDPFEEYCHLPFKGSNCSAAFTNRCP